MPEIKLSLLGAFMRAWLVCQQYNSQSIPQPVDAPRAHADGLGCDRVLIVGSGPAVGWGVTSQEIALPGWLARALSSHTRRGTDVDLVADMRINVGNIARTLRGLALEQYDLIVLVLGANDAVSLTPLSRWRKLLSASLTRLEASTPPGTRIVVTGIPPIGSVPGFRSRLGALAQDHGAQMNLITAELCRGRARTVFAPLSGIGELPRSRFGDGRTYRAWASEIADAVIPVLLQARWDSESELRGIVESRD
jgi:hypothetical protein